jgi:D-glycero-alpha-D-manno-heptose-7-phosphate kinase
VAGIAGGIEIASMADIPSKGSGLGSSSTYTVGLLNALYAFQGRFASREQLARQACDIEIGRCGEPIGKQDQYAAAFGGLNLIRFHPDESVSVDPVICTPSLMQRLEESTLVFFTGRTRSASAILARQSEQLRNADRKLLVRQMVLLAFDMKKELESGSLDSFGEILEANWQLKRQLTAGIADGQIDEWYATGMANGARGGKLLGAGNGGFMMFFACPEYHDRIATALGLQRVKFRFDRNGAQIVFFQPSE